MDKIMRLKAADMLTLSDPAQIVRLVVIASLIIVAGYALYIRLLPKPIQGIPYNAASARRLFGDIPELLKSVAAGDFEVIRWILDQLRKQDTPLFQIWLRPFAPPFVLLADFREGQDIMLRRGKEFDRSVRLEEVLGPAGPYHHISRKTDAQFRVQRKLLQDLMAPQFLHGVAVPNVYTSAQQLVRLWRAKARIAEGRPFKAAEDVFHGGLDAVLEFGFGSSFVPRAVQSQLEAVEGLDVDAIKALRTAAGPVEAGCPIDFEDAPLDKQLVSILEASFMVEILNQSPVPRLSWQFLRFMPKTRRVVRAKYEIATTEINKAVQRMNETAKSNDAGDGDGWIKSAVDHVVSRERRFAERDGRAPAYTSDVMVDEIFGFITAGHETTSTTLAWGLKLMGDHQREQAKLRQALQKAYRAAVAEKRDPSVDEITATSIPYLDATMEEILRCSGTIPLQIRDAVEDTVLLGRIIPKGTSVYILNQGPSFMEPTCKLNEADRSESCQAAAKEKGVHEWDPDNMRDFIPERWLVPGDSGEMVYDASAGPTLPFGLGIRGCYGRKLAYLELRIIFVLLVWNFELLPCSDALSAYDGIDGLTHKPRHCYARLRSL